MATDFDIIVSPAPTQEQTQQAGSGGIHMHARLTGSAIQLNGRTEAFQPGGVTPVAVYQVTITLSPAQIQPGGVTSVVVYASQQVGTATGDVRAPMPNTAVYIDTNNATVAPVPATYLTTSSNGMAYFSIIASSVGSAIIRAYILVSNVQYVGTALLEVGATELPENYDATGYGRVVLTVENVLSNALFARVQRLSNTEQRRRAAALGFNDTSLARLTMYQGQPKEIVFVPRFLQK